MKSEILTYREALVEDVAAVFNRENAAFEFVVPLTPEIFKEQIAAKSLFRADGCFLLAEGGRAVGLALTCPGVNGEKSHPDPRVGVIDGLFFPADRVDLGERLLRHCLEHLRAKGAGLIYGFASFGGYPFWRGLYMGAEPVCLTEYSQAWIAFMSQGFRHHQQSVNFLGDTGGMASSGRYRRDLDYTVEMLDICSPWSRDSWRGHEPKALIARQGGEYVGRIGFVDLPFLSQHRSIETVGIYGMSVAENRRREGIASSLMSRLFELCADAGVEQILVGTTVENTAARSTYAKAGMRAIAYRSGTMREYP